MPHNIYLPNNDNEITEFEIIHNKNSSTAYVIICEWINL